jgi:hypothetical protein
MTMSARGPAGPGGRLQELLGSARLRLLGGLTMMVHHNTPRWASAILAWRWLLPGARIASVTAFLTGGATKLIDFTGVIAEQEHSRFAKEL